MSVIHDLAKGSVGMVPVVDILQNIDGGFAKIWGKVLGGRRDKPGLRCQNCEKSPEEIGGNKKFAVCVSCKSKLDFMVHYCSQ